MMMMGASITLTMTVASGNKDILLFYISFIDKAFGNLKFS
jgi:hypothetical protein